MILKLLTNTGLNRFVNLLLVSSFFLQACAQSRYPVINPKAIFQERFPGTAIADDNGNVTTPGPDTVRSIYVETLDDQPPLIDSIWFYDRLYTATITKVETIPIQLGRKKSTGKEVILTPSKNNSLWHLELSSTTLTRQFKKDRIIIQGTSRGKPYKITLKTVIELQPEQRG